MRILFTTTGYPGHVLPLAPFASACVEAGHEVAVAGPRSAGPVVETLGLEFCSCADLPAGDVAAMVDRAAQLDPHKAHELMIGVGFAATASRALLPGLLQVVGAWRPDVLV